MTLTCPLGCSLRQAPVQDWLTPGFKLEFWLVCEPQPVHQHLVLMATQSLGISLSCQLYCQHCQYRQWRCDLRCDQEITCDSFLLHFLFSVVISRYSQESAYKNKILSTKPGRWFFRSISTANLLLVNDHKRCDCRCDQENVFLPFEFLCC